MRMRALTISPAYRLRYCSSLTSSSHFTALPLSSSVMAICVIAEVGVAPCQCFVFGGIQTTSPFRISSIGPPHCSIQPILSVIAWNVRHLPRRNPDGRGASTCADHRLEVRTFRVFGSIGLVNPIVRRSVVHRFEGNILGHAGGLDSPSFLP